MKTDYKVGSIGVLALAAGLWGLPALRAASSTTASSPTSHSSQQPTHGSATASHYKRTHTAGAHTTQTTSHHHQTSKRSQTTGKAGNNTAHHKAGAHGSTAYTRLAHMQMDPARVEDIQQALIKAGDFQGAPSGRWDSQTREAMARYQTDHGFGVTGLPDAKSLMKLGLGPHPLPPQLDKTRTPVSEAAAGDAASLPANSARDTPAAPASAATSPTIALPSATAEPPMKP